MNTRRPEPNGRCRKTKCSLDVRRVALFSLTLSFLLPQLVHADEREELVHAEVLCEEAAAQLKKCCGGLPRYLHCDYRPPSDCSCYECLDEGSRPRISASTYECLQPLSCQEVIDGGYCEALFAEESLALLCAEAR